MVPAWQHADPKNRCFDQSYSSTTLSVFFLPYAFYEVHLSVNIIMYYIYPSAALNP